MKKFNSTPKKPKFTERLKKSVLRYGIALATLLGGATAAEAQDSEIPTIRGAVTDTIAEVISENSVLRSTANYVAIEPANQQFDQYLFNVNTVDEGPSGRLHVYNENGDKIGSLNHDAANFEALGTKLFYVTDTRGRTDRTTMIEVQFGNRTGYVHPGHLQYTPNQAAPEQERAPAATPEPEQTPVPVAAAPTPVTVLEAQTPEPPIPNPNPTTDLRAEINELQARSTDDQMIQNAFIRIERDDYSQESLVVLAYRLHVSRNFAHLEQLALAAYNNNPTYEMAYYLAISLEEQRKYVPLLDFISQVSTNHPEFIDQIYQEFNYDIDRTRLRTEFESENPLSVGSYRMIHFTSASDREMTLNQSQLEQLGISGFFSQNPIQTDSEAVSQLVNNETLTLAELIVLFSTYLKQPDTPTNENYEILYQNLTTLIDQLLLQFPNSGGLVNLKASILYSKNRLTEIAELYNSVSQQDLGALYSFVFQYGLQETGQYYDAATIAAYLVQAYPNNLRVLDLLKESLDRLDLNNNKLNAQIDYLRVSTSEMTYTRVSLREYYTTQTVAPNPVQASEILHQLNTRRRYDVSTQPQTPQEPATEPSFWEQASRAIGFSQKSLESHKPEAPEKILPTKATVSLLENPADGLRFYNQDGFRYRSIPNGSSNLTVLDPTPNSDGLIKIQYDNKIGFVDQNSIVLR
jgi:hypothetical protein